MSSSDNNARAGHNVWHFVQRSIKSGPADSDGTPKWFVGTLLYWRTYLLVVFAFAILAIANIDPPMNMNPATWGAVTGMFMFGLSDKLRFRDDSDG